MSNYKMKHCTNCDQHKHLSYFDRHPTTPDKRSIFCTKCTTHLAKEKQQKHCHTCHELTHFNHFPPRKESKDKLSSRCTECTRIMYQVEFALRKETKARKGSFLSYVAKHHPSLYPSLINNFNKHSCQNNAQ